MTEKRTVCDIASMLCIWAERDGELYRYAFGTRGMPEPPLTEQISFADLIGDEKFEDIERRRELKWVASELLRRHVNAHVAAELKTS